MSINRGIVCGHGGLPWLSVVGAAEHRPAEGGRFKQFVPEPSCIRSGQSKPCSWRSCHSNIINACSSARPHAHCGLQSLIVLGQQL
eukprot:1885393-Amphidinium_carterae.2